MLSQLRTIAWLPISICVMLAFGASLAGAQSVTLAKVKATGKLACGVSDGSPGFSVPAADGTWTGLDADFCRAVAAAALGAKAVVQFVPVAAPARFPTLLSGKIDVLTRNTTWTLTREAALKVIFAGTLFFDTEAIMVDRKSGRATLAALAGARVCFVKRSTSEAVLNDLVIRIGVGLTLTPLDSVDEAEHELGSGQCDAVGADRSELLIFRAMSATPEEFMILPDAIGKAPLGPSVRSEDVQWFEIVRAVYHILILAEEQGLTQAKLKSPGPLVDDPVYRIFVDSTGEIGNRLGLESGWASDAISAVGNYGEIFERNLGAGSPFKMERGLNRLWSDGGLLYAPPLR